MTTFGITLFVVFIVIIVVAFGCAMYAHIKSPDTSFDR